MHLQQSRRKTSR